MRTVAPHEARQALCPPHLQACYQVPVSRLPLVLREALPRWARCADEHEALPRRTRSCFVQPLVALPTGELVEWRPASAGGPPDHFKVAATPDALATASLIEVDEQEACALVREIVSAATPSPAIRAAPAYFLTDEMRAMIAPGVSFPDSIISPDTTPPRSSATPQSQQVVIPQSLVQRRVETLDVSARTVAQLKQADVTTLGHLLEMEEDELTRLLDAESLGEVSIALIAQRLLPTGLGRISAVEPVFKQFYFVPSDVVYEDKEWGTLVMGYVSVLADRLTDARSGPVDTIWLSQQQVEQAMPWEHEFEALESYEVQLRVNAYAMACGATPPHLVLPDEAARERKEQELEEQYCLAPIRYEVFVSNEDLDEGNRRHESPVKTVLRVLERYQEHPEAQPVAYRIEPSQLHEMQYWIGEDRRRQFAELPHPAYPTIVKHQVYVLRRQRVQDMAGRITTQDVPELMGYRLIIGVLATTPVPNELIVEPRRGKPQCTAPERPIKPIRTPNYVPMQHAA